MNNTPQISVSDEGIVTRDEDKKLLATINLETGEVKAANAAYAKGVYKETIAKAAEKFLDQMESTEAKPINPSEEGEEGEEGEEDEVEIADPRIPQTQPKRNPSLGEFSAAHINYDHANMSDLEFSKKYKKSAECHLEFMAKKPEFFADIKALEDRFDSLNK